MVGKFFVCFLWSRHWKDHFKSSLRSVLLKNDLRSDQDHIFWKNDHFFKITFMTFLTFYVVQRFSQLRRKGCFYRIDELFFHFFPLEHSILYQLFWKPQLLQSYQSPKNKMIWLIFKKMKNIRSSSFHFIKKIIILNQDHAKSDLPRSALKPFART
jgi:hypothetical protein